MGLGGELDSGTEGGKRRERECEGGSCSLLLKNALFISVFR